MGGEAAALRARCVHGDAERLGQGDQRVLGLDRFGESGRYEDLAASFGLAAENVAARAKSLL
jgi:transketolase